ncbi:MAG: hypothetical protein JWM87_3499 [Candidatus Eremiobacteraeota bacterium]|nr:hypothetical protein [Candidatus Eremiobacteraeota bacterium]
MSSSADRLRDAVAFDADYYAARLHALGHSGAPPTVDHFLTAGLHAGIAPHPLFDPAHLLRATNAATFADALEAYAAAPDRIGPHPLFDPAFYLMQCPQAADFPGGPLAHFVSQGFREGRSPHPLFAIDWYKARYRAGDANPLLHWLASNGRATSPHPLFDSAFYLRSYGDVAASEANPLEHYIGQGGREGRDPHPLFSTQRYLAAHPDVAAAGINALLHYVVIGEREGKRTHPLFDPLAYRARYELRDGENALADFAARPERAASPFVAEVLGSAAPALSDAAYAALARAVAVAAPAESSDAYLGPPVPWKRRLLFVSHEASYTGAPLILLELVRAFAQRLPDAEIIVAFDCDGPLVAEFERTARVVVLDRAGDGAAARLRALEVLLATLSRNPPAVAFLNTIIAGRAYARACAHAGLRTVCFVHEFARQFGTSALGEVFAYADRVVYPAESVRSANSAVYPGDDTKTAVLPQGLLRPELLAGDPLAERFRLRAALGIPPDAPVVLGCGPVGLRKGVDAFVATARAVLASDAGRDAYFVWLGDDVTLRDGNAHNDIGFWIGADLERLGLAGRVLFVGQRSDPAMFFLGADVFTLTSREDPFPCAVHEAMAAGVPVVSFASAGGAAEALGDTGLMVPYFDVRAMAERVVQLLADPAAARALAARARERVAAAYGFGAYADRVLRLCENDLGVRLRDTAPLRAVHRRPKIFFASPAWAISGVNTFTETLMAQLANRYDCEVLFTTEARPAETPRFAHRFVGDRISDWDRWYAELRELFVREAPCAFVPGWDVVASAIAPTLPSNVGLLLIAHSDHEEHYEHVDRLGRFASRIVAVSEHIRDSIVALNEGLAERTTIVPYGVNVPLVEPPPRGARFDDPPIHLVYTGRIAQEQKRVLELADIAWALDEAGVPFTLTVAGEGPQQDELARRLGTLTARGCARLTGRLEPQDIAGLLLASDVFVLTSAYEGLSIALLEAMSAGCVPVVSDHRSGVPELIEPARNGYRIPIGDVTGYVRTIAALQRDRASLRRVGLAAWGTVLARYTASRMGDRYADVFAEMFEEMRAGRFRRPKPFTYRARTPGLSLPPQMIAMPQPSDRPWG